MINIKFFFFISLFITQFLSFGMNRKSFCVSRGETKLTLKIKKLKYDDAEFFVKILPSMYALVNAKNEQGKLPLEIALQKNFFAIAVALVKYGANIAIINNKLLTKNKNGQCFLKELIDVYAEDFNNYLITVGFKNKISSFVPEVHTWRLDSLITLFFTKCFTVNTGTIIFGPCVLWFFSASSDF